MKEFFSSDKKIIEKKFIKVFGFKPDFDNPKRFNEIINWQKLYNRNSLLTTCTDKLLVREYIAKQIGEKYLIPKLAHGKCWDEINYQQLEEPFIIKTNHGSGGNKIILNKGKENEEDLKTLFTGWLAENYYYGLREWQYKHIQPEIIVEQLLQDETGQVPPDFKFHCFNYGKNIEMIVGITLDRFGSPKNIFFDENWKQLDIEYGFPGLKVNMPPPVNWEEMCQIAKQLAADFKYVRVDLYSVSGKVYFGELTFSSFSGLSKFSPDKWDFIWGEKLLKTGILH